jgi:hypothetical protein
MDHFDFFEDINLGLTFSTCDETIRFYQDMKRFYNIAESFDLFPENYDINFDAETMIWFDVHKIQPLQLIHDIIIRHNMLYPIIIDVKKEKYQNYKLEVVYSKKQNIKIDKFFTQRNMISYQLIDAFYRFSA